MAGLRRVKPAKWIKFWCGREIDDVLHLRHHRNLVGAVGQMNALAGGTHVVSVEIRSALLEFGKIFHRAARFET